MHQYDNLEYEVRLYITLWLAECASDYPPRLRDTLLERVRATWWRQKMTRSHFSSQTHVHQVNYLSHV